LHYCLKYYCIFWSTCIFFNKKYVHLF
jgi:hypothetical protein